MPIMLSDGHQKTPVHKLTLVQIKRIDNALAQVGDHGAVKLIVEAGVVKCMEVTVRKEL